MTELERIKWRLSYLNPQAVVLDGLDDAIIGYARVEQGYSVLYSVEKCIQVFQDQGMSEDEATEHFEFNVRGMYCGEHSPLFVETPWL